MLIIVFGHPASGKTTALLEFKKRGAHVINCDKITGTVYYNKKIMEKVAILFGTDTIQKNHVNKKKLSEKIFSKTNSAKEIRNDLAQLSAIMHPLVVNEIKKLVRQKKKTINVLEINALSDIILEEIIPKGSFFVNVKTSQKKRLERLKQKYGVAAKKRFLATQLPPLKTPREKTMFINGDNPKLLVQGVQEIWKRINP
jgi:dephospho-CoA kinase